MVQLKTAGAPMRPARAAHCLGSMGDFDEARPSGNGHIHTAANGAARPFAGAGKYSAPGTPRTSGQPAAPEPGGAAHGETTHRGVAHGGTVSAHEVMRTSCGREITVGRLKLSGPAHPLGRISMNLGCEPHDHGQVWMSMTPSECRHLAGMLLAQAASAEAECATSDDTDARGDGEPARAARCVLPPGRIDVAFLTGEAYTVHARGHQLLTDQPIRDGGRDMAATPTELFVTSLTSCVAFYAGRYLARHGISREGLQVSAEFDMATGPARVGAIRLRVRVPAGLPDKRAQGLLAVVSHCTVGNTLSQPPAVDIALA
jgi:putative redox protein